MQVSLKWITPNAEQDILYMARVSNPKGQSSGKTGLIRYLIENKHWSPFEMCDACFEIVTSRAISAQMRTHQSFWAFSFQELSQRSTEAPGYETYQARRQDRKNRQNSVDDLNEEDKQWFLDAQSHLQSLTLEYYREALQRDIAKESARFLLLMEAQTKIYMKGTIRSWIHYLSVRNHEHAQKEHRDIAAAIQAILAEHLPVTAEALGW